MTTLSTSIIGTFTPGRTDADFSAPWLALFDDAFGWIIATVVFILAIVMVVGLAMWVAGKLGSSGRGQDQGLTVFGIGIVAAILVSVVGGIVMWATDLGPDWFNF
ncbi:MAG: hypothetical protein ACTHV8_06700 [Nesterenkonia sp.]